MCPAMDSSQGTQSIWKSSDHRLHQHCEHFGEASPELKGKMLCL
jgi:hypothetical protein